MKNKIIFNYKICAYSIFFVILGIFLCPKTAWLAVITPENITKLTNAARKGASAKALLTNEHLVLAAENKAQAIFGASVFSHDINGKKFSEWIKGTGYEYSFVGENLALDFSTSEGAMEAWLKSPTHRKNILNAGFTDIGVAVASGLINNQRSSLIVQIFGTPLSKSKTENASVISRVIAPNKQSKPESPSRLNSPILYPIAETANKQNRPDFESSLSLVTLNNKIDKYISLLKIAPSKADDSQYFIAMLITAILASGYYAFKNHNEQMELAVSSSAGRKNNI